VLYAVRDFFGQEIDSLTAKTPGGKSIVLSKVPFKLEIGDHSAFISKELPDQKMFKILNDVLNLQKDESIVSLLSNPQEWIITQANKAETTNLLSEFLATKVRPTLQQKIGHCADELISNAIYAVDSIKKSHNGIIVDEKPIAVYLSTVSEIQTLIIRDQYGSISQNEKSKILTKITEQTIAPQMDREAGGAGIGLNLVKEFCDFFVIRHCDGQWTEACCFFFRKQASETPFLYVEV
jgi:signal transduction histidine kinase